MYRKNGFTIVEVLVVLAVIALIFVTFGSMMSKEVDVYVHDKDYSETGWIIKEKGHWAQVTIYYDNGSTKDVDLWFPGKTPKQAYLDLQVGARQRIKLASRDGFKTATAVLSTE